MKLTVEPTPAGYTGNMAAMLRDDSGNIILIACERAHETAVLIARAVNGDDEPVEHVDVNFQLRRDEP